VGVGGYYWSGSAGSSSAAYYLDFIPNLAYTDTLTSKGYGFSVRCVKME
jgi:hypothetical protein